MGRRAVGGTEAARTRLHRLEPDADALWAEAPPLVARGRGVLVLDDTVLDKPHAKKLILVARQWSGKHKRVVGGIGLVTLLEVSPRARTVWR